MKKINEIKCTNLEDTVDTMLELLEENDTEWVKNWSTLNSNFKNYVTNKPYSGGVNIFTLWASIALSPTIFGQKRSMYYVTSKQAFELGGRLKKECKTWSTDNQARRKEIDDLREKISKTTDEELKKELFAQVKALRREIALHTVWNDIIFYTRKYYQIILKGDKYFMQDLKYINGVLTVVSEKEVSEEFALAHKDAIDNPKLELVTRVYTIAPIEYFDGLRTIKNRELVLKRFNTKKTQVELWNTLNDYFKRENIIVHEEDSNQAFYNIQDDSITIPSITQFESEACAFDTLSHEAMHSTGAKGRLNRDFNGAFGSSNYAKEELVAEMGSFFFMLESGQMTADILKNKLAYIKGYLSQVRENSITNNLISCVNNGRKAFEYVIQVDEDFGGAYEA